MARVRSRRLRSRPGEGFTDAEMGSLLYGGVEPFASDFERREAWRLGRDHLMTRLHPACRPQAWWDYEPGIPPALRTRPHTTPEAFLDVTRARDAWLRGHR